MKVVSIYPRDVHVVFEMSITEMKMLQSYIEKSVPYYSKVVEDWPESQFLEGTFLPTVKDIIEHAEKVST